MNIKIDYTKYHVYYIVNVLHNKYKFDSLDHAETFVKYCVMGCADIKDLSDVTIKIQYEEVDDDKKTD